MFHLAQSLYTHLMEWPEYSVLILGLDNAGKTTLLEELKERYIKGYKKIPSGRIIPTVGQNMTTLAVDNEVRLKFWDVGGQDALRELWEDYYSDSHGIVFVIDSCDAERLNECKNTLEKIINDDKVEGLPILMLANKQDMPQALEIANIKEVFNKMAEHLNANDSSVLAISARTGEGVSEAVKWIKDRVVLNKDARPPKFRK
ncbi:uncharacterized protein C5L36_0D02610 [Pichia kudriavzevii]|uniref:ADP-ribosylation factor-like protein 3 n=1 Tax=Pichia kudriavzevii TaxID=4909 RepID=A0A2U9R833_PICKU|nr:uncharacterized protein C5L36_0D02610 [Pichia kudriavzevii]AWU77517.1 hypothetical protein C5L36_0D02610 [Pichia kudriavzevii]